jgi:hypothetical protein
MMVNNKGMRCLHPWAWKSLKAAWCQFEERKVMDYCQCHWDGEGASLVCWLLMLLVMEESVVIGDGERDMWARVFFLLFFFFFSLFYIFFTPFSLLILYIFFHSICFAHFKRFLLLIFFFVPPLFHIGLFTPPPTFFSLQFTYLSYCCTLAAERRSSIDFGVFCFIVNKGVAT